LASRTAGIPDGLADPLGAGAAFAIPLAPADAAFTSLAAGKQ
jgi:hypothetical protein